jgi:hypothetical protein
MTATKESPALDESDYIQWDEQDRTIFDVQEVETKQARTVYSVTSIWTDPDDVWRRIGFTGTMDAVRMIRIMEAVRVHLNTREAGIKRQVTHARVKAIADAARALQDAITHATDSHDMMLATREAMEPLPFEADHSERKLPGLIRSVRDLRAMADAAIAPDRLGAHAKPVRDRIEPLVVTLADIFEEVTGKPARANMDKGTRDRDPEYRGPFVRFFEAIVAAIPNELRPVVDGKTLERILRDRAVTTNLPAK